MTKKNDDGNDTTIKQRSQGEVEPSLEIDDEHTAQLELLPYKIPSVKSHRDTMAHPMFSLSKKKETKIFYEHNDYTVIARNSPDVGVCTMFDSDLLKFIWSLCMNYLKSGIKFPKRISFKPADFFRFIGVKPGGSSYHKLVGMIARLRSTDYETTVGASDGTYVVGVSWFSSSLYKRDDNGRLLYVEVELSDWFIAMIKSEKSFLTLPVEYFKIKSATERRLYEVIRMHCGRQPEWSCGLDKLHVKVPSNCDKRKFRYYIKNAIKKNHAGTYMPQYRLDIVGDRLVTGFVGERLIESPVID